MLLVDLLLENLLQAGSGARIVVVSSIASRLVLPDLDWTRLGKCTVEGFPGYGRSKLLNCLYTKALVEKLAGTGIYVNASQPGATYTEALSQAKHSGGLDKRGWLEWAFSPVVWMVFTKTEVGALSQIYPAAHPDIVEQNIQGAFIGPYLPTIGWWSPSMIAHCSMSSLATDATNIRECWNHSMRLIQEAYPDWRPHALTQP
ncbi:hypothetical protein HDU91_002952, partial [Kappamyces sp. JEL0680]